MSETVVVIGGDAAGMSAASQALRTAKETGRELDVVVLERGNWTSYSACGIPYWLSGEVPTAERLVARTPEQHRANGIDVRLGTEALEIDLGAHVVQAREVTSGRERRFCYDQLVIATGAVPIRPDLPGAWADGIHGVQTLDDGAAVLESLAADREIRRVAVVGAGYIGMEVAEAFTSRGLDTTVVERASEPMTTIDPDMGALLRTEMQKYEISLRTGTPVLGFESGEDGWVTGVVIADEVIPADVVVLGIGVRPNAKLARAAGLPTGASGGIRVDRCQQVVGHPGIWAAGDCVETFDRVAQGWRHVPLGTHANKQGRVLGTNVAGGYATFPGVVGTAVSKFCDLEIARCGLTEKAAAKAGFEFVAGRINSMTKSGYMPGASPLTVKMIAERGSGRLLGAQIIGTGQGSGKRIDTCALALWNEMTAYDLAMTDMAYAPPFSPVWDPVQIAARRVGDAATHR